MAQIIPSVDLKWGFPYFSPNGMEPSPYLYQIGLDHEVGPGILFHDCLVKIAEGHRKHEKGRIYSCYGSWIGSGVVWLMYPMNAVDERDKALSDEQILSEVFGEEEGKQTIEAFRSTLIKEDHHILKYCPTMSNPSTAKEETPLEYIYYAMVELNEEADGEAYQALIGKAIEAHNEHEHGLKWVTYAEENSQSRKFHLFAPMRNFSAMDNWQGLSEILSVLVKEEAKATRDGLLSGVNDYKSYLMTFVPSCDNSGCEFVE